MSGLPSGVSQPRVSVVMANHNGAAHLAAAIRSVLTQTVSDLELIVADDASTDDSLSLIRRIADDDPRVVPLASDTNGGPGAARNRALERAQGDWIAVIDSDDLFHPRRLERLISVAKEGGHALVADDLIFFTTETATPPQRLLQQAHLDSPANVSLAGLLDDDFAGARNHLGYVKPVIRRQALGVLRYRTDLRVGEDFDLLLRLAAAGQPLTVLPEAWYLYRRHAASISHRLGAEDAAAMLRAMQDFRRNAEPLPAKTAALLDRRIARMTHMAREAAVLDDMKSLRPARLASHLTRRPAATLGAARKAAASVPGKLRRQAEDTPSNLLILAPDATPPGLPASWRILRLPSGGVLSSDARAELTAATADRTATIHSYGDIGPDALGFVPEPARLDRYPAAPAPGPLVHVRTTAYKRPEMLRRALTGLQAQTTADWVCDVYDDDPDRSGEAVVRELADPRIRYSANAPQRRASRNLDRCFTRFNPHGAAYFCVVEDDNQLLPGFMEENIRLCEEKGVRIVLRNQFIEHQAGTADSRLSDHGLLEGKLPQGICPPETLHLSVMADMGVSNGGLFWSRHAVSDLEIGVDCSATFQEYLRTIAIAEPVYVALEPLAVWAENGDNTVRDFGETAGWLRRELELKRSVQVLQRHIWKNSPRQVRQSFLQGTSYRYPPEKRATGLVKSFCRLRVGDALPTRSVLRLLFRGALIRLAGRPMRNLDRFLADRRVSRRGRVSEALP